jgi:hypothetical protein
VPPLSVGRDTCSVTTAADGRIVVFGGKMPTVGAYATAEAYGPRLTLAATTGAPGDSVVVSGNNFAANATVRVFFDAIPIELATTDANGGFASVVVIVPALAAGAHAVRAVDDRSRYPMSLPFTIE